MRRACIFLALFVSLTWPVSAQFGGLGKLKKALDTAVDVSKLDVTQEDEILLGESISQKVRETFGVVQDEAATRYVTLVGQVIAAQGDRPGLPYSFIVLDSNSVNAFAAPGGFVHITRGALALIRDEAELAGVLGHEIAHITRKHTLNELKKLKGIQLADGHTSLTDDSVALEAVSGKMTEAILKGFGRKEELDADKHGASFAFDTGYEAGGLIRFLEQLKTLNGGSEARAGLFASHPETDERLKKLQKQLKKPLTQGGAVLAARFDAEIKFSVSDASSAEAVEGVDALTKSSKKGDQEKKKGGLTLAGLSSGFKSDKNERAEVSGTGAAKGVGNDTKVEETGAKNPALVAVKITPEDLKKFQADGKLQVRGG